MEKGGELYIMKSMFKFKMFFLNEIDSSKFGEGKIDQSHVDSCDLHPGLLLYYTKAKEAPPQTEKDESPEA